MKIAICDDDRSCRARVLDIATDYAEERKDKNISFEVFADPEELLRATREGARFDVFVLDIVMPGMNGIRLGQALRDDGEEGKIIYLTSSEEYALDSFKVRAFDYLIKPVQKASFYKVMDDAINSIHIKRDKSIIIKTRDGGARVALDSILYAELSKRAMLYHLVGGNTLESTTLRTAFAEAVGELAADSRFARCGVSTVVNLHHVSSVESEAIVFIGGKRIFASKKLCRELRLAWNDYWMSQEG